MISMLFLVLIGITIGQQIQPVPTSQDGFAYGPESTNYTLDVFYDHLCDGSALSFPGLYQYWQDNDSWLRMVIHIYPLPYHYYSFTVGRAGRFIQREYPSNFTSFLNWFFNNQNKYLDTAEQWPQNILYNNLAADTQTATGVSSALVLDALDNSTYDYDLRISWKYASSKGITGTPQFMLNGVWVPSASNCETAEDWEAYFNSLN